jgi:hypothetical protein
MDKYRSEWQNPERGLYSGNGYAEFNTTGKVLSIAWLISPKIDMDTHTNEILTLEPPNITLMWIPIKLAGSICFY